MPEAPLPTDQLDRLKTALSDRYAIERELGSGGMATVYLAEDLKLNRKVAVKVLRPELAAILGAERFLKEIEVTANLQHPNILPLHDSGEADGFLYYVMPYVEGESLRQRLDREKQLGVDETVEIAKDIAAALDYAHEHGVVHRDIKPENILVQSGQALVADFGIALAVSQAGGTRLTETGLSLGTPHYMSPEQATGDRELDARSDVYSLGCVVFEMLVGDPPHLGGSAQAIIAKILTDDADPVAKHRHQVPVNVDAAVQRALAKTPADRFTSAAQFAEALTNPAFTQPATQAAVVGAPPADWRHQFAVPFAMLAAVATVVAFWGWLRPEPPAPVSRQRIVLGNAASPGSLEQRAAVAPDGSSIVFVDSTDSGYQLKRKLRGELESVTLAGTQSGHAPFFSPDGAWIGFVTEDGKLRKVPSGGGGSLTLAENANANAIYQAAAWLDDGSIVYVDDAFAMSRVPGDGGTSETVAEVRNEVGLIVSLSPLPGGRGILFTGCPGNCIQGTVFLYDIPADTVHLLFEDALGVWYAPTGHVLYTDLSGGLYAAEFDLDALAIRGGAVPVLDGVRPRGFTLSPSGIALYLLGGAVATEAELVWVTREGTAETIDAEWKQDFNYPALSPDGTKLAVSVGSDDTHLWIKQLGAGQQKLTFEGTVSWRPAWTPDGETVAFVSNRAGTRGGVDNNLYTRRADGSAMTQPLLDLDLPIWEVAYSQDGQWLLYRDEVQASNSNIHAKQIAGDVVPIPLLVSEHNERQLALSPDGQWLAYASDESGRYEVYVVPFPDVDTRWLVSRSGGTEPRWAHSGRELFFKSAGMLMSVDVEPESTFTHGEPQPLFSVQAYRSANNRQQYDVAPDDRRFVMIRTIGATNLGQLVYVENFFEELKAKVGK